MGIGDVIFKALTGTGGGPDNFGAMVNELVTFRDETGMSRRAQAKLTGIPETTLRRWEGGIKPSAQEARIGELRSAYRAVIASPGAVARWRDNNIRVTIDGIPVKGRSGQTSVRHLDSSTLRLKPGTGERVVDAFLAGNDGAAARALVAGIGDQWYRDVVFGTWIADDDDDLAYEGADIDSDYSLAVSAS